MLILMLVSCRDVKNPHSSLTATFRTLEKKYSGHLGIAAINTANNRVYAFNGNQRFPFCSTFKFMLVAAILNASQSDKGLLSKRIDYSNQTITSAGYTPETSKHIKTGMTVRALCKAAITLSDSGAANLLVQQLGGPQAVVNFSRSIGDKAFYLVRIEPNLNTAVPGDKRDTTTPLAMATSMREILLSNVLSDQNRKLLQQWLIDSKTGGARIRAGAPKSWLVGDKTGTGAYGSTNDIAILWPPHKRPMIFVIYFTTDNASSKANENIIALASSMLIKQFESKKVSSK